LENSLARDSSHRLCGVHPALGILFLSNRPGHPALGVAAFWAVAKRYTTAFSKNR
jgi:hypothetical protein